MRYYREIYQNCAARLFGFHEIMENTGSCCFFQDVFSEKKFSEKKNTFPRLYVFYVMSIPFLWKYMATGGSSAEPEPLGASAARAHEPRAWALAHGSCALALGPCPKGSKDSLGPHVGMYFHKKVWKSYQMYTIQLSYTTLPQISSSQQGSCESA